MSSSIDVVLKPWECMYLDIFIVDLLQTWAREAKKSIAVFVANRRRQNLFRLLGELVTLETASCIRTCFQAWAVERMHKKACRAMQTGAELSYFANAQIMIHLILNRWMSIGVQRRFVHVELLRIGDLHRRGIYRLVDHLMVHRYSRLIHVILSAWLRAAVDSGRIVHSQLVHTQLESLKRRVAMAPAEVAATRILKTARITNVIVAWYIWKADRFLTQKEAILEACSADVRNIHERSELTSGITLLLWAQEKLSMFARLVLLSWCRFSVSAARHADVVALESDRAMLEEATDFERQRRLADVDLLLNRAFLDSDREFFQSCFLEWRRTTREGSGGRTLQRVQAREIQTSKRFRNFLSRVTAPSIERHGLRMDKSGRFLMASIVTIWWRRQALDSILRRTVLWRRMDWCKKARMMVYVFARRNPGSDLYCKAVFLAWEASRDYQKYTYAIGDSFARRLVIGHALCSFLAWHLEVVKILLTSSKRSSENLREDGYCKSPAWRIVARGFLLWHRHSADQRRGKLTSDLRMMVTLLQQASGTIEDLRIRLLLVRVFGLIRRQVFVAWRKIIENQHAREISEAAQAASRSLRQESSRSIAADTRQSPAALIGQSLKHGSQVQRAPHLAISDDQQNGLPDTSLAKASSRRNEIAAEAHSTDLLSSRRTDNSTIASPHGRDGLLRQLQAARQTVVGYSAVH
jgi:hypothetical protein